MAINKKLIHFTRYAAFKEQLEAGNILDSSIVWIQDANLLYTHGKIYSCGSSEITYREIWYTTEDNTIVTGDQLENSGYIANVYCDGFGRLIFENTPTLISNMFDRSNLTSIILPEGITELPNYLFSGSYDLKSITLPNGLLVIGDSAFQSCESLTHLEIPNTVTHIGENAFLSTGIQELIIPDSVLDDHFICEQLEAKKLIIGKNISGTISITDCPYLEEICSKSPELQTLEIEGVDALENLTVRLFTETPPATNDWERVATTTSKIIIPTAGWTAYQEAWGDNIQCQLICGGDDIHNSILWVPQNLTEQQKTTIADNIATDSAGSLVRYSPDSLDIYATGFYDDAFAYALPTNPDPGSYDDMLLSKSMFSNWNTYVTTFTYADIPEDQSAQIFISDEDYWRIQDVLKRGKILIPHHASAGGYITSIEYTDVQAGVLTFDVIFLVDGNKKITWTISAEARSDGGYDSVIKQEILSDVYVLPFTAQNLLDSADDEGGVIQIEGYVNEIDEAIKANKTFMVKQDSNSMWNVVFLEFTKQSAYYRFICIVDQRMVKGEIAINGNFTPTMSCIAFTPVNIQDEIAKDSSNIYIADFSYETAKEQQFRVSSEFIQAIYDNKVILVPLYPSDFGVVGYAIVETPEIDGSEVYFRLRNAEELVFVYGAITDNGGAEVYNDGISRFVSEENLKTINGESLVGSGDIIINGGSEITEDTVSGWGFTKNTGTITKVQANGTDVASSGVANIPAASTSKYGVTKLSTATNSTSTSLAATASAVKSAYDLANSKQDKLTSGTNIKTINGQSLLGSGDITISGGSSGSGAYEEVNHGTSDTTFTLTPNTFHVWDEVTSLGLDFGAETSGVANEYLFQFTSGSTATTLTLPDDIKWANDTAPTIEVNKTYQVSVLKGLGSVLSFESVFLLSFIINTYDVQAKNGMTWEEWVNSDYNTLSATFYNDNIIVNDGAVSLNGVLVSKSDVILSEKYYIMM